MDGMGQQFLAGTGFTQQQHRGFGTGAAPGAAFDFQGSFHIAEAVAGRAEARTRPVAAAMESRAAAGAAATGAAWRWR